MSNQAEADGSVCPYALAAIRLLILTRCRLQEFLHLRWSDVDFQRKCCVCPTPRRVPSSSTSPSPPVTGSRCGGRSATEERKLESDRSDLKRPWKWICENAELEDLRIHDLRHSFATVGAGLGLSLPMIGKLLGHSQANTKAQYAHLAVDPMNEVAERIGSKFSNLTRELRHSEEKQPQE